MFITLFKIYTTFHFGSCMCKSLLTGVIEVQTQSIIEVQRLKESIIDEEYALFSPESYESIVSVDDVVDN